MPAGLKLLCLIGITASLLFGFYAMAAVVLVLCAAGLSAGIRPWELLRGIRGLALMLLLIIIFRSIRFTPEPFESNNFSIARFFALFFNAEGFFAALRFAAGIVISFSAAGLFFSITTMTEIRHSLSRVELFLLKPFGVKHSRLSLGISLMLAFMPRFFELWEGANLACDSRAGKKGLRRLRVILPLVCERMIETAAETAYALESRGLEL
jgi:biotin transport system permease protein